MHLVQCRAYSVKHAASPPLAATRRCEPFMSPVIQLQSASAEHRDVRRRYAAYFSPLSSTCLQASRSLPPLWSGASFPRSKRICARGNLDTGQPFSYCYELRTQHRLESVATRTPPPICTSAQGSQTALVLRTAERCEQFEPTRWLGSDNPANLGW